MLNFNGPSQQGPIDRSENPLHQYHLTPKQLGNLVIFVALFVIAAGLLYNLGNSTLKWIAVILAFIACLALTLGARWMYFYNQRHERESQVKDTDD